MYSPEISNRVPLLNFLIPVIIIYPLPQDSNLEVSIKVVVSILLFLWCLHTKIRLLSCRSKASKLILVGFGSLLANLMPRSDLGNADSFPDFELLALVEVEREVVNQFGRQKVAAIIEVNRSRHHWRGKQVFLDDKFFLLSKSPMGRNLVVRGVVRSNGGALPILEAHKIRIAKKEEPSFADEISELKTFFVNTFWEKSSASKEAKAFIIAFTTGNKRFMSPDNRKEYVRSGAMHLFAVSGLHFGILYFLLRSLFRIFFRRLSWSSLSVLGLLFLYLCFVDFAPSAQRAFLMIFVWEATNLLHKKKSPLSSLCFSFCVSFLMTPDHLGNSGFQLSYSIVLALIWFSQNWPLKSGFAIIRYSAGLGVCAVAAFLGSFIILLGSFGQFVPISLVSNILLIPFALPLMLMFLTYLGILFSLDADPYQIVDMISRIIHSFIGFSSGFPYGFVSANININAYFYIFYPLFIIAFFNTGWGFAKKVLLSACWVMLIALSCLVL